MAYSLSITRRGQKQLDNLPRDVRDRMYEALVALGDDPRPLSSTKLKGQDDYRIRVGDYRAIYHIDDDTSTVTILRVGHRRDIYRDL